MLIHTAPLFRQVWQEKHENVVGCSGMLGLINTGCHGHLCPVASFQSPLSDGSDTVRANQMRCLLNLTQCLISSLKKNRTHSEEGSRFVSKVVSGYL